MPALEPPPAWPCAPGLWAQGGERHLAGGTQGHVAEGAQGERPQGLILLLRAPPQQRHGGSQQLLLVQNRVAHELERRAFNSSPPARPPSQPRDPETPRRDERGPLISPETPRPRDGTSAEWGGGSDPEPGLLVPLPGNCGTLEGASARTTSHVTQRPHSRAQAAPQALSRRPRPELLMG